VASDPYSERFVLVKRPGFPLKAFVVPAGKRAIVRSITYYGYLATSPAIFLQLAGVYVFALLPPASTFGGAVEMFQVVYQGEMIVAEVTASAGDMGASVSGYLLSDPGTYAKTAEDEMGVELTPHPPLES
jgi:hypothetical protein